MLRSRRQRTICEPVSVEGFGYWRGHDVRVEFRPAPAGSGIVFVRDDIGPEARIAARAEYRIDVPRRTNLQFEGVQVEMVEHAMAALAGLQIDNCEVGVDQSEMPGCDGSSLAFVEALDSVGTVEQDAEVSLLEITEVVRLTDGEAWVEARPSAEGQYRIEFELDYPYDDVIGRQSVAMEVTPERFRRDLAPCRTFILEREAEALVQQGLGSRVTPQDLLIFSDEGPVDNELRFENECARHKALDLIGDLALAGGQIEGQIVAYRSSHKLNAALARELEVRFSSVAPQGQLLKSVQA
ncbi:MAG: UDP-3-O-[3-hydroxymyristoyl] N-acetylglucosamine deacetylase [Planctomycetes bacterium]|nr:UDP-3-O-[3-hydroxymyristoyl] N-acetylglucosamine deacetylase [Planctomycetota bacterium]